MVFVEPVQPPLAYLLPVHAEQSEQVISAVASAAADMYLPELQLVEWSAQLLVASAAHVLPVQAAHEPAAVAEAPVNLVVPSFLLPHDVWSAQLLVASAAYVPSAQAAHEPAAVVEAPVNLVVPSPWLPHEV